jgi:2-acylglycerol O-acyltransferase 2
MSSIRLFRADLVPVFSFGENDVSDTFFRSCALSTAFIHQIYNQMPNEKGTTIYALQKKFQSMFGFTLPLFHGRGLLNCELQPYSTGNLSFIYAADNLGLMPYRRRIVSVSECCF